MQPGTTRMTHGWPGQAGLSIRNLSGKSKKPLRRQNLLTNRPAALWCCHSVDQNLNTGFQKPNNNAINSTSSARNRGVSANQSRSGTVLCRNL